jgi:hypothetical protein
MSIASTTKKESINGENRLMMDKIRNTKNNFNENKQMEENLIKKSIEERITRSMTNKLFFLKFGFAKIIFLEWTTIFVICLFLHKCDNQPKN